MSCRLPSWLEASSDKVHHNLFFANTIKMIKTEVWKFWNNIFKNLSYFEFYDFRVQHFRNNINHENLDTDWTFKNISLENFYTWKLLHKAWYRLYHTAVLRYVDRYQTPIPVSGWKLTSGKIFPWNFEKKCVFPPKWMI